jgi:cytochrome c-type biogenesis protein CcmH
MIWLWIAAALISAALAALIVQRAAGASQGQRGVNPALAVYRRQMAELDELAERGVLAEGERRSVRAETGRRLLAAAERGEAPLQRSGPRLILLAAAAAPLAAFAAYYFALGAPNFADQPFKARLADWRKADEQTLSAPQLAAVARAVAAENPTDPHPLARLALAEMASGEPTEAVQALHRAIALTPREPVLWRLLARVELAQQNGEADALDAYRHVLALEPGDINAGYFVARERIASGDVAGGLAAWRAILARLRPGSPESDELARQIAEVAASGALPDDQPPADASVAAPQIQAMVDGLAARLQASPDDPAGWVRLVRAYTVLGEIDRRDAALASARRRYVGRPDILAQLAAAEARPALPNANVSPPPGSP